MTELKSVRRKQMIVARGYVSDRDWLEPLGPFIGSRQ
jgi:hypothetical protein